MEIGWGYDRIYKGKAEMNQNWALWEDSHACRFLVRYCIQVIPLFILKNT